MTTLRLRKSFIGPRARARVGQRCPCCPHCPACIRYASLCNIKSCGEEVEAKSLERQSDRRAPQSRATRAGDGVGRQDYYGGAGDGSSRGGRTLSRHPFWHELLGPGWFSRGFRGWNVAPIADDTTAPERRSWRQAE